MQFNYKAPDTSVNVSSVSPLKRGIQLIASLSIAVLVVYTLLGLLINVLAPYLPASLETRMGKAILAEWTVEEDDATVESYQEILEKLIGQEEASVYEIRIIDMDQVNAFAIPGGFIVFSTAFVEAFEDEETVAFALGHELGHFMNRDHIKAYGRSMVLYTITGLISGEESASSTLFLDVLSKAEMKFSQSDELKADAYGAGLLYEAYGSYNGGLEFFDYLRDDYSHGQLASYFDSHPHPEKRVKELKKLKN